MATELEKESQLPVRHSYSLGEPLDLQYLLDLISSDEAQQTIDLCNVGLAPSAVALVAFTVPRLQSSRVFVRLCDNPGIASDEGISHLSQMLKVTSAVVSLDISGCQLTDELISSLAPALAACSSLRSLYLAYNNIGYEGARELLCKLASAPSNVRHLDLSLNPLGDDGPKAFANCLYSEADDRWPLESLFLNDIGGMSNEGCKQLAESAANVQRLRYLHAHSNGIGLKGATRLVQLLRESSVNVNVLGGYRVNVEC